MLIEFILMRTTLKAVAILLLLQLVFLGTACVKANTDPLNASWYVTDSGGNPINGAKLTFYYSTSTFGPFATVSGVTVEDKIANTYQNPAITGDWNPNHLTGIANVDLYIADIDQYLFYVQIDYGISTWFWPDATSTKPGDPSWHPASATGSPTLYAASGYSLGNDPTTAYPTKMPTTTATSGIPLSVSLALLAVLAALVAYALRKRFPQQTTKERGGSPKP
jgi:hypothetical protein